MKQLLESLQSRLTIYRVLARLYQLEIDAKQLDRLQAIRFPDASGNPRLDAAGAALNRAIAALSPDDLDELAADYARTFLSAGVVDGVTAFPYESVYTSPERLVMQDAYEAVLAVLQTHGVAPSREDLYADHIGVELEFMGFLADQALSAVREQELTKAETLLDEAKEFLETHLLNWTDRFFADEEKVAATEFYRVLAVFAREFLGEDKNWLAQ